MKKRILLYTILFFSISLPRQAMAFAGFNLSEKNQVLSTTPFEFTIEIDTENKEDVLLLWSTSTKIYFSHFEVERSSDGKNWDYLSSVQAESNSAEIINYQIVDSYAAQYSRFDKKLYYRIKNVQIDGSFDYSPVRLIQFD